MTPRAKCLLLCFTAYDDLLIHINNNINYTPCVPFAQITGCRNIYNYVYIWQQLWAVTTCLWLPLLIWKEMFIFCLIFLLVRILPDIPTGRHDTSMDNMGFDKQIIVMNLEKLMHFSWRYRVELNK